MAPTEVQCAPEVQCALFLVALRAGIAYDDFRNSFGVAARGARRMGFGFATGVGGTTMPLPVSGDTMVTSWSMEQLLREMIAQGASDLILTAGSPPQFRIHGALTPMATAPLHAQDTRQLACQIGTEEQRRDLTTRQNCDFSIGVDRLSRFRVHIYQQRDAIALTLRAIPLEIPDFHTLNIPDFVHKLLARPNGLILVTGPVGSGKSTTLASMIDFINHTRQAHIVCIEDPIEYLHEHRRSVIEQREVHNDTPSFEEALRAVFRESPDVIMVGEMRDLETIRLALTLAETGHLILTTLHTQDTTHAVNRIVDVFPPDQQPQITTQLSMVLIGVLAQQLLPTADGRGLVLATEILHVNNAVRNLIRDRQVQQIPSVIQTHRHEHMITMTDALHELCLAGRITTETALHRAPQPKELVKLLAERAPAAPPRRNRS
jgi:twitching motility protein PilT